MTEQEIEIAAQRVFSAREAMRAAGDDFSEELVETLKNNESGKVFEYVYKFKNDWMIDYALCPPEAKERYEELKA